MRSGSFPQGMSNERGASPFVLVGLAAVAACAFLLLLIPGTQASVLTADGTQPFDVPSNLAVSNAATSHKVTFVLATPTADGGWPADGNLVVQFPAAWTDTAASVTGFALTGTACSAPGPEGIGSIDLSAAGRVILTRDGTRGICGAGIIVSFTINGLDNPAASGRHTIDIRTRNFGSATIDSVTQNIVLVGALSGGVLTTTPATPVAGASTSYSFSFAGQGTWPADGNMVIEFPTSYAPQPFSVTSVSLTGTGADCVSGAVAVAKTTLAPGASPVGTVATPTLTLTRSGGAACVPGQTLKVTVTGVKNPGVVGAPGSIVATTFTSGGSQRSFVDGAIAAASSTLTSATGAAFTAADVGRLVIAPGILPAGTTITAFGTATSVTVSQASVLAVPAAGIHVTVATGLIDSTPIRFFTDGSITDAAPVGASPEDTLVASPAGAAFTVADLGRTITGPGIPWGAALVSIVGAAPASADLSQAGTPGPVAAAVIDLVKPPFVMEGALTSTSIALTPTTAIAGTIADWKFTFTTANAIPANGAIRISFPADVDVSGVTSPATMTGCTGGTFIVSRAGQLVTIQRDGAGATCPAGTVSVTLGGIRNPRYAGLQSFATVGDIRTSAPGGADIDFGTASVTINPGTLTSTAITATSLVAGATTSYTFAYTFANDWQGPDLFMVTFPTGYVVSGVGATPPATGCTSGTFGATASGQTVTVSRTGTPSTCFGGSAATITLSGIRNPAFAGASGTISFRTATNAAGNPTIDTGSGSVTLTPGAITPTSVAAVPAAAGSTASHTFTFGITNAWPFNGMLTINFPAGVGVSTVGASVASSGACSTGTFTAARVGTTQDVTITRLGGSDCPAGTTGIVLSLANMRNPSVPAVPAPTAAIPYGVSWRTSTSAGAAIDATADVPAFPTAPPGPQALTFTAAALTTPTLEAASTTAGAVTSHTAGFTLANAWPADGAVRLIFPTGYGYTGLVATATSTGCTGGTLTATNPSANTVLVTRSGGTVCPAGTLAKVTVSGIRNVQASGATGTGTVRTETSTAGGNAAVIIDAATLPSVTLTPGTLAAASITPGSVEAGETTSYTFQFTTTNPWPADGSFVATFPAGFTLAVTPNPAPTGCDGTWAPPDVSGQTYTLTRIPGTSCAANTVVIIGLNGITNPLGASNNLIAFQTQTAAPAAIDTASVLLSTGPVTPVIVGAADPSPDAPTTYTFFMATTTSWPADGNLEITFPTDFIVGAPTPTSVTLSGCDGTLTSGFLGQVVTLTRTGGSPCPPGSITITFDGVTNPTTRGRYSTFDVQLQTNAGAVLEQHSGTIFISKPAVEIVTPNAHFSNVAGGRTLILVIQARDLFQNGVAGVPISWAKTGDGTLNTASSTTDDSGAATAEIKTSATAGAMTITATAAGLTGSPLTFKINAPGTSCQGCPVADRLDVTLSATTVSADTGQVTATALGYNAAGQLMGDFSDTTFFTVANGGTCTGKVCTGLTKAGNHDVTGNYQGVIGKKAVTVTPGAPKAITQSALAVGTIGPGTAQALQVTAEDQFGNGVAGVSIAWAVTAGGGTISPTPTLTGTTGTASATLTTGPTAGANTATATATGLAGSPLTFNVPTAAAASITSVSSGAPRHPAGVPLVLAAIVKDSSGKGIVGAKVSWTVTGGGAILTTESLTDATGTASATFTRSTLGTSTAKASVAGLSAAASFEVTTFAGPVASLQLTPAVATIGLGLPQTFTVTGADAAGNPLGAATLGVILSSTPNASCVALTCTPTAPGTYKISAVAGGVTDTATLTVTGSVPSSTSSSTSGPSSPSPGVPLVALVGALIALVAVRRRNGA